MSDRPADPPAGGRSPIRAALRLVLIGLLVWGALWALDWAHEVLTETGSAGRGVMAGLYFGLLSAYAVLLAIPFVPGVEIGLSLMMMRGAEAALPVYVATVAGLMIAFAAGRYTPTRTLCQFLWDLHLTRASSFVARIGAQTKGQRLDGLRERLPKVLRWIVVDYRYVGVALLINLPGNAVIGGGGGILLLAGLTRLFEFRPMLVTILIAVAPVPLAVWGFGRLPF